MLRRRALPQAAWVLLALAVGFLVLWPILQLQWRAFVDSGSAFGRMADLPRIGTTIQTTFVLAVLSSVLAVCIGTLLAWCASRSQLKAEPRSKAGNSERSIVPYRCQS